MKAFVSAVLFCFLFLQLAFGMPVDWRSVDWKHVVVYYNNASPGAIKHIGQAAEDQFLGIAERMGLRDLDRWSGDRRIKIHIFDNSDQYQRNIGEPAWSDGSSIQRFRAIYSFFGSGKFIDTVLPHEIGHIIFRDIIGFENLKVPVWVEEGVSALQERKDEAVTAATVEKAFLNGTLISIRDLSRLDIRAISESVKIDLFYAESYSIVKYLTKEFGWKRLMSVCGSLRNSLDVDGDLALGFGFKDINALEKDWQRRGI
jgi:hypothetical protein